MGAPIPPLVMAFVSAFFAAQCLAVYLRTHRSRELLTFAYATFSVALYDLASSASYSAVSPEADLRWEVVQIGALAIVSVAMLFFLSDHTGYPCRRFAAGMGAGYGLVAVAVVVVGTRALFLAYLVGLSEFVWVGLAAAHQIRKGAREHAFRLLAVAGFVFASAVNDLLVDFGVMKSAYTLEYAFMVIVVLSADSLSTEFVKTAKTEDALRDSEARYRMLFEFANDAIFLMRNGRFVDCNSRTLEMFGCGRDDILDHLPTDFSPAFQKDGSWSVPAAEERIRAALAGTPQRFEWLHCRKDGTLFDSEVSLSRIELGGEAFLHAMVRDITERTRIEDENFRSHQMLQLVLDTIPQRVFWKDRNFKYQGCNRPFALDAGLVLPDEIIGKDDFKLTWHASAPLYRADDARVMREDAPKIGFEEPQERSDGTKSWLRTSKVPLHDADGKVVGVLGTYEDITDRKRAEDALRGSEQRFRSLVETTSDWVWEIDRDGRYCYSSPKVREVLGFEPDEIIGTSPFDLMPAEEVIQVGGRMRESMAERRPFSGIENVNVRKDGRRVVLETSGVPVFDGKGEFSGYRGIDRDVTERKHADEALRASEALYRQLIEQAADGIFIADPNGRFILTNSATRRLLGYTGEEMRRLSVMDTYPPEEREEGWRRLAQIQAGRSLTFASTMLRKDGSAVEIEASAARLRDGRLQAIVRDVTERKRLEEQLVQSQKMEAIGNLAGGVAHDFNNLLQAMLTDALLVRKSAEDPDRVRKLTRHLEQEIMRGGALTRQLLVFSRRETTKPQWLDLNEVVRAAAALLCRLLRENIELIVALADEPLGVSADHGQLDQVLMNLAVNAADAMPEGGRLTVRTGRTGNHAWVAVEDTGLGIPDEIRGRIFEPFFTTKSAGKGTGLGLSVVHGIVTRHGGTVAVDSRFASGTTFTVQLPLALAGEPLPPVQVAEPAAVSNRGQGERILVVEDEAAVRNGLVEILRMLGYRPAAADCGATADRLASEEHFDLVLCDLLLPDGSGAGVVSGLLQRWPDLRVVLMSGYAEDEAVRLGVTAGSVRFLQKPFDIDTLARELSEALTEDT